MTESTTDATLEGSPSQALKALQIDAEQMQAYITSGQPLKELLDLGDHVWETMYDFGFRNYQNGQFAMAEYWWIHTCLFDCRHDRNWIALGMAYQRQQKYEQALNAFSLAVHHGSTNPWAPLHAAECHLQLMNPDKAASALDCAQRWIGNADQPDLIRKRVAMLRKGVQRHQERLVGSSQSAAASNSD